MDAELFESHRATDYESFSTSDDFIDYHISGVSDRDKS